MSVCVRDRRRRYMHIIIIYVIYYTLCTYTYWHLAPICHDNIITSMTKHNVTVEEKKTFGYLHIGDHGWFPFYYIVSRYIDDIVPFQQPRDRQRWNSKTNNATKFVSHQFSSASTSRLVYALGLNALVALVVYRASESLFVNSPSVQRRQQTTTRKWAQSVYRKSFSRYWTTCRR